MLLCFIIPIFLFFRNKTTISAHTQYQLLIVKYNTIEIEELKKTIPEIPFIIPFSILLLFIINSTEYTIVHNPDREELPWRNQHHHGMFHSFLVELRNT